MLLALMIGTGGCQLVRHPTPLRLMGQIRTINAAQTRVKVGSTIYVEGTVGDRIPLVNGQVYQLEDATGQIWVVTSDSSIDTGESVLIRGTLSYQAAPEYGEEAGERYLWEVRQIERSP